MATILAFDQKVKPQQRLVFCADAAYENLLAAKVRLSPLACAWCVRCDHKFTPRYVGDQVCGVCRCR